MSTASSTVIGGVRLLDESIFLLLIVPPVLDLDWTRVDAEPLTAVEYYTGTGMAHCTLTACAETYTAPPIGHCLLCHVVVLFECKTGSQAYYNTHLIF